MTYLNYIKDQLKLRLKIINREAKRQEIRKGVDELYPVLKPCARCKLYFYPIDIMLYHKWDSRKWESKYFCMPCYELDIK
jgi:hypothetical protein